MPSGGRIAACWYATSSFQLNVNFTDGASHPFALYLVDWDGEYRSEIVKVSDTATGTVLDTENILSFTGGLYLSWNISGNVTVTVTATGGANAVVSGVFFGGPEIGNRRWNRRNQPAPQKPATARFVSTDSATEGAWPNVQGIERLRHRGPSVFDSFVIPSYATFSQQGFNTWTWVSGTNNLRALRIPGGSGGIAAAWYNLGFQFNLAFTDGATHQFGLYAVDWDNQGRAETIQIADANTGTILDSRSIASFVNGTYLVWDISGSVVIKVIGTSGPNGVVSAVFFDPVASGLAAPPPIAPTWVPQIALNWTVIPGATSYKLYRGLQSGGPYNVITSPSSPTYTDTSVVSGTAYFYVVTAVNSVGESPKSTELSSVAPKP